MRTQKHSLNTVISQDFNELSQFCHSGGHLEAYLASTTPGLLLTQLLAPSGGSVVTDDRVKVIEKKT